jgi:hypothetical protein
VSAVDDALDCRLRGEGRGQGTCSISFSLSATNPLILHLSAYNVNSRPADISRYKDGERFWTTVMHPEDT